MQTKDELIDMLIDVIKAEAGHEDCLYLPDWDHDSWKRLLSGANVMVFGNGEIVLQRHGTSNDLYFLVEGTLEVSTPQPDSLTLTAPVTRNPGSIVGEIAFLDGGERTASVWSRGESVLLRLPESKFHEFCSTDPKLACDVLCAVGRIVAERLRRCMGAPQERSAARKHKTVLPR